MKRKEWTKEKAKLLIDMWSRGMSAAQIAKELSMTRNAVIGKAHRLGLSRKTKAKAWPERPLPKPPVPRRRIQTAAERRHEAELARKSAETPLPDSLNISLMDLTDESCRWPYGDPRNGVVYCGRSILPGSPYCLQHTMMAYREPTDAEIDVLRKR